MSTTLPQQTTPVRITRSLRFQIALALGALVVLFSLFGYFTLRLVDEQRAQGGLLRLAGELQATAQQLAMQAMHYRENIPADPRTYNRDLQLYYRDLARNTQRFDTICRAFSSGDFKGLLERHEAMHPMLGDSTMATARHLETYWKDFRRRLDAALGDREMPDLARAADLIVAYNQGLVDKARQLLQALDSDLEARNRRVRHLVELFSGAALVIAVGLMFWFYRRVLRPLDRTLQGFAAVATGNFSYRLPETADNEIGLLARGFNRFNARLEALFRLTACLQQGSDLDQTLAFVSRILPELLPLDWVGALFVTDDGMIQLERAYGDGRPDTLGLMRFPLSGTLLEQCLHEEQPLHIPDVHQVANRESRYRFLKVLADRDRRDAIFLPVSAHSPLPGVLVFATRQAHAYTPEHLELLANLTTVITLSFGRTLRLADHARLAAIGQFASGIAHEIRTPLATLGMALDYFAERNPDAAAERRLALARRELGRIERLLDEVLLYARPLSLRRERVALDQLMNRVLDSLAEEARAREIDVALSCPPDLVLVADEDRLVQIFLNLLRNALEASPPGSQVKIAAHPAMDGKGVMVMFSNPGELTAETLERIFEPFYTTKAQGTGLGLAIVRRLVEAHGGRVSAASQEGQVRFSVILPRGDG